MTFVAYYFEFFSVKQSLTKSVQGMAILNAELFVVFPSSADIDVYDIRRIAYRRTITVTGLSHPHDIVADKNILFVSDLKGNLIHRIRLPEESVTNWSVNGTRLKLSVTETGNVIVACWGSGKIIEYNSNGLFIREIVVQGVNKETIGLQHAIPLKHDRFLICHTNLGTRGVCIINNKGELIKSYGMGSEQTSEPLDKPVYLAVDRKGFILVTDYGANRIIQLNSSLEFVQDFIPAYVGLIEPFRMCLHEGLRHLFVAEQDKKHFLVFDI